jgi:hypothetical protein
VASDINIADYMGESITLHLPDDIAVERYTKTTTCSPTATMKGSPLGPQGAG